MSELSSTTETYFSDRLLEGETFLWRGRPGQGIIFAPRDLLLIPFSLVWGGFAIFWEMSVLKIKAAFPFELFGVPFVLVGLFLIFGRFLLDAWLRTKIVYALTNRRLLIVRSGPWPDFKAISLDGLQQATLSESSNGRGTIRLGQRDALGWMRQGQGFGSWIGSLDPTPQLVGIDGVRQVFAMIQERSQAMRA